MDIIQEKLGIVRFEHTLWLNELLFALKEIDLYENRLMDLLEQYADTSEEIQLDGFLNDFDLARKSANELHEQIKEHLNSMTIKIASNGHLKAIVNSVHDATRDEIEKFRTHFSTLKLRFRKFAIIQNDQ